MPSIANTGKAICFLRMNLTAHSLLRLLSTLPRSLSAADLKLYNSYMSEKLFDREKYVTADDIARSLGKKLDRRDDRFIQMMRHLHIIREVRKGSVTCYIWIE